MRITVAAIALVLSILSTGLSTWLLAAGQVALDTDLQRRLRALFPTATTISPKGGTPPHFKLVATDPTSGSDRVIGLAFWTTELEPLERGYDGPIKILVGMDTGGVLRGILVVDHHEPYGDFSIEPPAFAAQFVGKSISDPFRLAGDIDAVSRATITVTSAARAVRPARCSQGPRPSADTARLRGGGAYDGDPRWRVSRGRCGATDDAAGPVTPTVSDERDPKIDCHEADAFLDSEDSYNQEALCDGVLQR